MRNGFESISFTGPNICETLSQEIQEYESLLEFKVERKSGNPVNCPYKFTNFMRA